MKKITDEKYLLLEKELNRLNEEQSSSMEIPKLYPDQNIEAKEK